MQLYRLLYAESAHLQLQAGQDFGLVPADVALDGLIGEQFGKVALGHQHVKQV